MSGLVTPCNPHSSLFRPSNAIAWRNIYPVPYGINRQRRSRFWIFPSTFINSEHSRRRRQQVTVTAMTYNRAGCGSRKPCEPGKHLRRCATPTISTRALSNGERNCHTLTETVHVFMPTSNPSGKKFVIRGIVLANVDFLLSAAVKTRFCQKRTLSSAEKTRQNASNVLLKPFFTVPVPRHRSCSRTLRLLG